MRLRRSLIWIPLAIGAAIVAAGASLAHVVIEPAPTPYYYAPYYGPGPADEPGSCYEDSLQGRVCRD